MKLVYVLAAVWLIGCASNKTVQTSTARENLEDKYRGAIGKATKADLTQDFGNAEWCTPDPSGEETCRFYRKLGTKWIGEAPDKKALETFDEIVAEFDSNGKLTDFKARSQR